MPKVAIVSPDKARAVAMPEGYSGNGQTFAYCDAAGQPIHVHLHRLAVGEELVVGPLSTDCVAYVWEGTVKAGSTTLAAGSSFIVEHGARAKIVTLIDAVILTFAGSTPSAHGRSGGHVHLLPVARVPKASDLAGPDVGGGMHADGSCQTCEVWLHENWFPAGIPMPAFGGERGIHSHSEDEVIFVTKGAIRLGQKLFPAGTAVAITSGTMYHIAPGPDGMTFINFRAATPTDIAFANGSSLSETQYWTDRLPRPEYLTI